MRKDKGTKEKLNNTAVIKWILAKVTQKGNCGARVDQIKGIKLRSTGVGWPNRRRRKE